MASLSWQQRFQRMGPAICWRNGRVCADPPIPRWILPGSFNPLHRGHQQMAEWVASRYGQPVVFELSTENVDKPPLDESVIEQRLSQFAAGQSVWVTRAAQFVDKAALFAGGTFLVGADTLTRIADHRYYGLKGDGLERAIARFHTCGCRFLVFGRKLGGDFVSLDQLQLPPSLRVLCGSVAEADFREDVSSTELRRKSSGPS